MGPRAADGHPVIRSSSMSTPHDHAPHHPTTAAEWDERYSGERVWSGNPNQALVAEAADLPVGRALDIGCGEGADSVWLASRGWRVTSLDISSRAVELTLRAAREAGVEVTGVAAAFADAALPAGSFELVSAMYPVLPADGGALEKLLGLVAPGGHLLFVHHAGMEDHDAAQAVELLLPADIAAALRRRDGWELLVDELRDRHVAGGQGAHHAQDLVVHARREH